MRSTRNRVFAIHFLTNKRRLSEYKAAKAEAAATTEESPTSEELEKTNSETLPTQPPSNPSSSEKKRKLDDANLDISDSSHPKRSKTTPPSTPRYHNYLPPPPTEPFSLFLQEDFRDHLCRCPECYPQLSKHRQLLEEEDSYEPPLSESGEEGEEGGESVGTGSLLDRGEAALSNVDRVRAIGTYIFKYISPVSSFSRLPKKKIRSSLLIT